MTQTALEATYKPCEMEAKFTISEKFQQTALLCRSQLAPLLSPEDFDRVFCKFREIAIVRLREQARAKFSQAECVVVPLQRPPKSAQRQTQMIKDTMKRVKDLATGVGEKVPLIIFSKATRSAKAKICQL